MKNFFKMFSWGIKVWVILTALTFIIDLYSINPPGSKTTLMGIYIEVISSPNSIEHIFGLTKMFVPALLISVGGTMIIGYLIDYLKNSKKKDSQ